MHVMDHHSPLCALVLTPSGGAEDKLGASATGPAAKLAGVSMFGWVIDALMGTSVRRIAVVGVDLPEALRDELQKREDRAEIDVVSSSTQEDPIELISRAMDRLEIDVTYSDNANVLVVCSDVPQLRSEELRDLVSIHKRSGAVATVIPSATSSPKDPIVSYDDDGSVESIIEPLSGLHDGTAAAVCVRASLLRPALRRATPSSWLGDVMIDDALAALDEGGHEVLTLSRPEQLIRVETPQSLVLVETELRDRVIDKWVERGVQIPDPRQVSIDATVELGTGVRLLPGTVLEGMTIVGDDATIGPNTHVVDATIGSCAHAPSVAVYGVEIEPHARLTPFTVHGSDAR